MHVVLSVFVDGITTDVQNRKKFNDKEKVTMEAIHVSNKEFLFEILQEYKGTGTPIWLKKLIVV